MEDRLNYNTARSGVVSANKHTLFHSKVMDLSEQGKIFSTKGSLLAHLCYMYEDRLFFNSDFHNSLVHLTSLLSTTPTLSFN